MSLLSAIDWTDLEAVKKEIKGISDRRDEWRDKALALKELIAEHERNKAIHCRGSEPFARDESLYSMTRRVMEDNPKEDNA